MNFAFQLLSEQGVILFLQNLVGAWAKSRPWIANRVVPALTYAVALLGFTLAPATAHAAGLLAGIAPPLGNVFGLALFNNLLATGGHSTWKNTVVPSFWGAVKWLANMGAAKADQKAAAAKVED